MNAIGETFETIQNETYSLADVEIVGEEEHLVLRYAFRWSDIVDGSPRSGSGRGTHVVVRRGDWWLMLREHLSA